MIEAAIEQSKQDSRCKNKCIETAITFAKWLSREGWERYDDPDRWICQTNNNNLYTTRQVFMKSVAAGIYQDKMFYENQNNNNAVV